MHRFIKEHHHNEEEYIFPKIAERATIPDKMSDDHEAIESTVQQIDELVESLEFDRIAMQSSDHGSVKGMLSPTCPRVRTSKDTCTNLALGATLAELRAAILTLIDSMNPHLLNEEKSALPAMTANFTPTEMKPVFDKMIGHMEWFGLPHFYRQHKVLVDGHPQWDRAAIRRHATGVLGMSPLVFDFIIFPTFKRYDTKFGWAIMELKDPSQRAWCEGQRRSRATWFRRTRKAFSAVSGRPGTFSGKVVAAEGGGVFATRRPQSAVRNSARGVEVLQRTSFTRHLKRQTTSKHSL